jgi:hypothetical protein
MSHHNHRHPGYYNHIGSTANNNKKDNKSVWKSAVATFLILTLFLIAVTAIAMRREGTTLVDVTYHRGV